MGYYSKVNMGPLNPGNGNPEDSLTLGSRISGLTCDLYRAGLDLAGNAYRASIETIGKYRIPAALLSSAGLISLGLVCHDNTLQSAALHMGAALGGAGLAAAAEEKIRQEGDDKPLSGVIDSVTNDMKANAELLRRITERENIAEKTDRYILREIIRIREEIGEMRQMNDWYLETGDISYPPEGKGPDLV